MQIIGSAVALLLVLGRVTFLGRLLSEIVVRRGNTALYFPLVACLVLRVIVNVIPLLFHRE